MFIRNVGVVLSRTKQLMLSFTIVIYTIGATAAEISYPLVTYKCNVEDDTIVLTNSMLDKNEGPTFKYSDEAGTFSPWNLVEIERTATRDRVVRTKTITRHCMLSSGKYTITLEPKVFSKNFSGPCGKSISSFFTVTNDGYNIKGRMPFENYCRGNAPIISRVTVFGKTSEVKLKRIPRYKFY